MNAQGVADVKQLIDEIISKLEFNLVFSDNLTRTHHSALLVAPYSKSKEVITNDNATAWGCGELSGQVKTPETIAIKKFFVDNPHLIPPGENAETINHSMHRWLGFLAWVISLTPPGEASFIACHSSSIKTVSRRYGAKIKVNPAGLVKMTITASGVTFEVLSNGRPEHVEPDPEEHDERIRRFKAVLQKSKEARPLRFAPKVSVHDTGEYDEAQEAVVRKLAADMSQYAEDGPQFDPKGDYLCGGCSQMDLPSSCGVVASDKINPDTMSCRYWVKDIPLVQLDTKFTPRESGLTERPNVKGFGCKRCEYGSEAVKPDSAGRPAWCSWWGMHVLLNACCAKNEGSDDVTAN
jgi:broad specificity phosphatase PhoE